jgi:hypothetical protein
MSVPDPTPQQDRLRGVRRLAIAAAILAEVKYWFSK